MATTTKKKPTAKEVDMSDVMAVADESATIDLKKTSAGVVRIEDTALINVILEWCCYRQASFLTCHQDT